MKGKQKSPLWELQNREDYLHKITREIVDKKPSLIGVEDLNIKGMMQNRKVARAFGDTAVRGFINKLKYKQEWNGGKFVVIDRFYPSSKTCHKCYFILDSLPLEIREWNCPKCNTKHDRDINASKVILAQSLAYNEHRDVEKVS